MRFPCSRCSSDCLTQMHIDISVQDPPSTSACPKVCFACDNHIIILCARKHPFHYGRLHLFIIAVICVLHCPTIRNVYIIRFAARSLLFYRYSNHDHKFCLNFTIPQVHSSAAVEQKRIDLGPCRDRHGQLQVYPHYSSSWNSQAPGSISFDTMSCFSRSRPSLQSAMPSSTELVPSAPPEALSDDVSADTIIISSDEVRFRVHRHILSNASPIFDDMFSIPTPSPHPGITGDDLPVVPMMEPCTVVEQLLRFCYPSLNGAVQDFKMLRQLFAAADKYDMKGVNAQLCYILRYQFLDKEPFRAYSLACIYGLEEEAKLAAKQTLLHTHPGPLLPEYDEMSATMYYKLVVYRQKCVEAIQPFIKDWAYKVCGLQNTAWTSCRYCASSNWFASHLDRTKAAYMAKPRGSTITSTKVIQQTLTNHFGPTPLNGVSTLHPECLCRIQAPIRLIEFNEKLAALVEQKIAEVRCADNYACG